MTDMLTLTRTFLKRASWWDPTLPSFHTHNFASVIYKHYSQRSQRSYPVLFPFAGVSARCDPRLDHVSYFKVQYEPTQLNLESVIFWANAATGASAEQKFIFPVLFTFAGVSTPCDPRLNNVSYFKVQYEPTQLNLESVIFWANAATGASVEQKFISRVRKGWQVA